MNERLKFRAYFEETISDSEDNGYIFKFCLNDIAIFDSDMIGIYTDDFKEQIRQAFEKFKEKNPKLTEDDLQHIIEEFCEDNSCDNEDWLNISRFESIVQSTGLKDKNKKPVFEGDIIKYDDTEEMSFWTRGEIGVVKFKPGRFSICLSPDYDGKMTGTSNMMQEDMEDCITIIGNIHQNRELLEKGGK